MKRHLKHGTHWRQSWIQHSWLCVALPCTHWQQSWTYRQQSRPRQAVEFTLLPICCQFSKVDRVEFNFVASVYRA